jgi:enterochelin esterase-like enzyme
VNLPAPVAALLSDPPRLERLLTDGPLPVVEDGNAYFLCRPAPGEHVALRHWIRALPSDVPFQPVPGRDVSWAGLELPPGSRVEYKFEVTRGGQRALVRDPLNPNQAHDPFGANSVVYGEGYEVPDWTQPDDEARPGELRELAVESAAFGGRRDVSLYLPARFRSTRRYPLIVVHDGADYLNYTGMRTVLDNLIHRLEIPPLVVAFTQSPDRLEEYAADPRHGRFLAEELLPAVGAEVPLLDTPAARGLVGASFGAVAALSAAWQHPGVWGRLLLQSGSFVFTDIGVHEGPALLEPVVDFVNAFRAEPGRPAERVYLSCGVYEGLIVENRSMLPVLQRAGLQARLEESRDGHNWENWRDRLRTGLSWLFPGPLWMVYE